MDRRSITAADFFMTTTKNNQLGLVVEGGGIRAIYAAGVLDVLHDLHLPLKGVIGVSAGALHGCSFVAGQQGRSFRYYKKYCRDDRFFSFKTWIKTGNIVDTQFCYHDIHRTLDPFDNDAFMASPMRFYVTCTNVETGKPEYFHIKDFFSDEIDLLRASASLPYFSRIVEYGTKKLLDGGCSDPVPVKAFQSMGYTKNILVLTQPRTHRKKDRDSMLARWLYWRYPAFCDAFENCPKHYEETLEYIDEQERLGNLFVIRPTKPIQISRLTHDPQKIIYGYEWGRKDALESVSRLQAWLQTL